VTCPKKLPPSRTLVVNGAGEVVEDEAAAESAEATAEARTSIIVDYSSSITSGGYSAEVVKPRGMLMRALSFDRKAKAAPPAAAPPAEMRRASMGAAPCTVVTAPPPAPRQSLVRKLSFKRSKGDERLELDIFKESPTAPLGMQLSDPIDRNLSGAIVSHIDWQGAIHRSGKVKAGDVIQSVNGVATPDRPSTVAAMKAATGILLLGIIRRPLPPGWRTSWVQVRETGEYAILYSNKKQKLRLLRHPMVMSVELAAAARASTVAAADGDDGDHDGDDDDDDDSEEESHAAAPPTQRASSAGVAPRRVAAYGGKKGTESGDNPSTASEGIKEFNLRSTSL